jgi:proteasome lid subunit RPN8/RPN11
MSLVLTSQQKAQIEREGVAAHPNECCGAMLGKDMGSGKTILRIVHRLEKLTNSYAADEQYHRFSLNPRELMELDKRAGEMGMAVLGFYHSHPDHPARPSETDRLHAWPYYSYVIVSISKGADVGGTSMPLTSWQLDEATEQFVAEEVIIESKPKELNHV